MPSTNMPPGLIQLTDFLRALGAQGPMAVALSGGLDSRFLLHMGQRAGIELCAVHAQGPHIPAAESAWARQWTAARGISLLVLDFDPLALEGVRDNSPERCYYCKQHLLRSMRAALRSQPTAQWCLCDGTNADDCHSHRPGLRALKEEGIRSPLAECGVDKAHIRAWAALTGLEQPAQAARPCLLTRLAYGMQPSPALLHSLAQTEAALAQLGLQDFRLRLTPSPLLQSTPLSTEQRERARTVLAQHGFGETEILEEATIGGFFDRKEAK